MNFSRSRALWGFVGISSTDGPLSAEEDAFVEAFLGVAAAVQQGVESDLAYEQHRTLSEYTVLQRLAAAPGRTLRINELAGACGLSASRMSRLVEKLESQGLLRREQTSDDRRGWNATLNEAGAGVAEKGRLTYAASARRHLLDRLGAAQLTELTRILRGDE